MNDNKYPGRNIREQMRPTAADVKKALIYNPETGEFTRRSTGAHAGYVFEGRYLRIRVGGRDHQAHRLAWLYMTGEMPKDVIDHIDGDGLNNKFANLREASRLQNRFNARAKPKKSTLPRGVYLTRKVRPYRALISIKNRRCHLGYFPTPELASEFYELVAEMVHGEFAYHLCSGAAS